MMKGAEPALEKTRLNRGKGNKGRDPAALLGLCPSIVTLGAPLGKALSAFSPEPLLL